MPAQPSSHHLEADDALPPRVDTGARDSFRLSSKGFLGVCLALALALLTLGLAIWDEPLHIDELRQVGYYSKGLRGVVGGALAQTQPPLDYLIGAAAQWALSPTRFIWRLPSAVFAWMALAVLGGLMWRFRQGGWLAIALLALTPVFLEFSSYARPYALPFFLMMVVLLGFERWRSTGRIPYLIAGGAAALALPLSRTTEPPLFLFITLVLLALIRLVSGQESGRWTRWPMVLTGLGLVGAAAVIPFVETGSFRADGLNAPLLVLRRIWSEILPVHASYAPLGLVGLIVGSAGVALILWRALRHREVATWWALPPVLTALASPVVFAVLSRPGQPYYDRYAYFAAPALVLGIATVVGRLRSDGALVLVGCAFIVTASFTTVAALNEVHRTDYEQVAMAADDLIAQGNVVVFEQEATLAAYRPQYVPGAALFLPSPQLVSVDQSARGLAGLESGRRPVLIVSGLQQHVDGWTSADAGGGFYVLTPDREVETWDTAAQAEALWSACEGLSPDTGSQLCVTAVRMLQNAGDQAAAGAYAEATLDRIETPVVRERMAGLLHAISPELAS